MQKKYIVRLTDQERDELTEVVKKLKGSSQKVRRAQILLKADADGPSWTDERIAEAFGCRTKTVENIPPAVREQGFEETLDSRKRRTPPVEKLLAASKRPRSSPRAGSAPAGFCQLDAAAAGRKVVELEIVESVSHETVRRTLKKTG